MIVKQGLDLHTGSLAQAIAYETESADEGRAQVERALLLTAHCVNPDIVRETLIQRRTGHSGCC